MNIEILSGEGLDRYKLYKLCQHKWKDKGEKSTLSSDNHEWSNSGQHST